MVKVEDSYQVVVLHESQIVYINKYHFTVTQSGNYLILSDTNNKATYSYHYSNLTDSTNTPFASVNDAINYLIPFIK